MRDLADGGDLIAERAENGRQRWDFGALRVVIALGTVAGGPQAGEQRGAARSTGGRGDEGVRELQAIRRELCHVRRADFRGAVGLRIELAVVVGDEDDDVGLGGERLFRSAQRADKAAKRGKDEAACFHVG